MCLAPEVNGENWKRCSLRGSLSFRKSMGRWSLALNIRDLTTDGMWDTGRRKGYRWSLWIGGGRRHAYGLSTQRSQHQPAAWPRSLPSQEVIGPGSYLCRAQEVIFGPWNKERRSGRDGEDYAHLQQWQPIIKLLMESGNVLSKIYRGKKKRGERGENEGVVEGAWFWSSTNLVEFKSCSLSCWCGHG